jgi:hypothetical protein
MPPFDSVDLARATSVLAEVAATIVPSGIVFSTSQQSGASSGTNPASATAGAVHVDAADTFAEGISKSRVGRCDKARHACDRSPHTSLRAA